MPAAGDRAMDVTEEDVAHGMAPKDFGKGRALLEDHVIGRAVVHGERMMMHEQKYRSGRFGETVAEPRPAISAQPAGVGARLVGIEKNEAAELVVEARLHEAVPVDSNIRKFSAKGGAV